MSKRIREETFDLNGVMTRAKKRRLASMTNFAIRLNLTHYVKYYPNAQVSESIDAKEKSTEVFENDERKKRGDISSTPNDKLTIATKSSLALKSHKTVKPPTVFPKLTDESPVLIEIPNAQTSESMAAIEKTTAMIDKDERKKPGNISSTKNESLTIAKPDFLVGDIIWAKIKGSVHWPAKIDRILTKANRVMMYEIIWYNDYRRSKIYRLQANKFLENFEQYASRFDDVIGLKTAAFEAMFEYRAKMIRKCIN